MLSKKTTIWLGLIFLVVIVIGIGINKTFFRSSIQASEIVLNNIIVLDEVIKIEGFITSSGKIYRSHRASYKDGALFLEFIGGLKGYSPVKEIDIEIKNRYGEINEIYILGSCPAEKSLIWRRESN